MRRLLVTVLFLPLIATAQYRPQPKSSFGVTLSLPWLNTFTFYDYELQRSSSKAGFVGVSTSLFYKTEKDKISASIGLLGCSPVPFGPYDRVYISGSTVEENTSVFAVYLEATWHKRIYPRINLVAGINYVEHEYSHWKSQNSYAATDFTGGLTTGAEYLFGRKNFSLAFLYRPVLITFTGERKYRHIISLDARFDINIFRSY